MTDLVARRRQVAEEGLARAPLSLWRDGAFERFVEAAEPPLRTALIALYGHEDGRDATAEALAYAWEHWDRVCRLENGVGYLFRVAQSRSRRRRVPLVFVMPEVADGAFEPELPRALRKLSDRQRVAVFLVHGFGYSVQDVAALLGVKPTSVRNHLERGLRHLRRALGVNENDG